MGGPKPQNQLYFLPCLVTLLETKQYPHPSMGQVIWDLDRTELAAIWLCIDQYGNYNIGTGANMAVLMNRNKTFSICDGIVLESPFMIWHNVINFNLSSTF